MQIGYARVSTDDQKVELQRDALRAAGCERIIEEKVSATRASNPKLSAREIAAQLGVHRATLYRSLQRLRRAAV
jgi:DNA invertase Pin-like site-specific DNA recombinase